MKHFYCNNLNILLVYIYDLFFFRTTQGRIHIYEIFNIRAYLSFCISSYVKEFLKCALLTRFMVNNVHICVCMLFSSFHLCKSLKHGDQNQALFASIIIASFEKASTETNALKNPKAKKVLGKSNEHE